jgi:hypothetical protein
MKASTLLRVLLAGATFVAGAAVAAWVVLWASLHSSAVRVPDVRGLEITRAIAAVQEEGLFVRVQEGVFAPDIGLSHVARRARRRASSLARRHVAGSSLAKRPSGGDLSRLPTSFAEAQPEEAGLRSAGGRRSRAGGCRGRSRPGAGQSGSAAPASEVTCWSTAARERHYVAPDFTGEREVMRQ